MFKGAFGRVDLQRNAFFIVDILYKEKQFLDIELFVSLTRDIEVTEKEVRINIIQSASSYFFEMMKIFEEVRDNNFFEIKLGFVNEKSGDVTGGYGFFLTKFDYELGKCADQSDESFVEILLKFGYNNKRVLLKKDIEYETNKRLPDLQKMALKIKLDEI